MQKLELTPYHGQQLVDFEAPTNTKSVEKVPPGFYGVQFLDTFAGRKGYLISESTPMIPDNTYKLTDSYFKDMDKIGNFFDDITCEIHSDLKVRHKMGILLSGTHGTGKTTACYELASRFVKEMGTVVIAVNHKEDFHYTENFINRYHKDVDAEQTFIRIFDECDKTLEYQETAMKTMLDNHKSAEKVMTFFTTNYIQDIPAAIIERKSRIKFHYVINGITDEVLLYELLVDMNTAISKEERKLTDTELKQVVKDLIGDGKKGPTLDEVKHAYQDTVLEVNLTRARVKLDM